VLLQKYFFVPDWTEKGTHSGCFAVLIGILNSSVLIVSYMVMQVASVMTVWNQIQPTYAANMWNEALNKRLETQVLWNILLELQYCV
jgi:hypothetical protein